MPGSSARSAGEIIREGRDILRREAEALTGLAESLGEDFHRAVELVLASSGRLAVTGMGKSGHVAKKVSATFSSTGTPSYFIHPAEASHGDLGMLGVRDAVLAFSNSGETEELSSILDFCARHKNPVIGVTKRPASFLARQSAVALILPDVPEACPIGCAPTTSTTMMMALGDALALCLLQAKGFTSEDFHRYHPGGSLGRRLLQVRDIMHTGAALPLVAFDAPLQETLPLMTLKSFGCTGVLDENGLLAGIITDGDLRRHMNADLLKKTAGQIMTANPVTVSAETLAARALGLMQERSITNIFVAEGRKPVGILHIHDCLRAGLE